MSEQSGGKLNCPLCGRVYRWRPDLAGQSVRCQCGQVLSMPTEPITEAEPETWGADTNVDPEAAGETESPAGSTCPWCGRQMPEEVSVCVHCGYDLTTGKPLEVPPLPEPEPPVAEQPHVLATGGESIPIENGVAGLILAAGFIALIVAGTMQANFFGGVLLVIIVILIMLVFSLPMYLGCVIVNRILKCDYGGFGSALPKLMAMWIAPMCIDAYAPYAEQKQLWFILTLAAGCLLLSKYFFRLTWVQAMVTAAFILVVPLVILLLVALVIVSLVGVGALKDYIESVQPNAFDAPAIVEYVTGPPSQSGDLS